MASPSETRLADLRRRWVKPLVGLGAVSIAIFFALFIVDHYYTGGTRVAEPGNPASRYFLFDPEALSDATSAVGGLMAAVLGIVITVVSIVVQLSAGRYSGVAGMFFRDRTNLIVLGFYIVGCIIGLWLSFSVRVDYAPRASVVAVLLMATGGLALMGPYFTYVFWFLEPENIIARIRDEAIETAALGQAATDSDGGETQVHLVSLIEELTDLASGSIAARDKIIASRAVDALKDFALHYLTAKETMAPAWFNIGSGLRRDPAFVALDPESRFDLERRRTWVEWKVLRQLLGVYNEALAGMKDITYLVAIDTRYIGEAAAFIDDHELVVLTTRFMNSYLRATLNARDVRTVYNVMNQYRLLVEKLMRLKRVEEAIAAAEHMKYYGVVGYDMKITFVTETVAYDLAALCQVGVEVGFTAEEKLLRLLLDLDRPGSGQDPALAGVRKAQAKLAAFYLLHEKPERAALIREDMSVEPQPRLRAIRDELCRIESKDFWEIVDRGRNFEYMPPEQREKLQVFFAYLDAAPAVKAAGV